MAGEPVLNHRVPRAPAIGGWLSLLGIGIFFGPLATAASAYTSYTFIDTNSSPGLLSILRFEAVGLGVLAVFNIVVAWAFFRRLQVAPALVVGVLVARALFCLCDYAMVESAASRCDPSGVIQSVIVAAIWIPYLMVSKRVKATFVAGNAGTQGATPIPAIEPTAVVPAGLPTRSASSGCAHVRRAVVVTAPSERLAPLQRAPAIAAASRRSPVWLLAAVLLAGALAAVYGLLSTGATASSGKLSPDAIFAQASPAVVQVEIQDRQGHTTGSGSGFLVSRTGFIVTNYHVVRKAHSAHVIFADKTLAPVDGVAALDEQADLAILRITGRIGAQPLDLGGGRLPPVGAKVYAIGNPLGQFANTLSDGLVSAHREQGTVPGYPNLPTMIQTTAPISHGSSGGPLFAADGKVVGVTTLTWEDDGGRNVNFAVPASHVATLLHRCDADGSLTRLPLLLKPDASTCIKNGRAWADQGEYDKAIKEYNEALRLDPKEADAYSLRGDA